MGDAYFHSYRHIILGKTTDDLRFHSAHSTLTNAMMGGGISHFTIELTLDWRRRTSLLTVHSDV